MYHFLSGYTARVAGTEKGLGNEPQATFSTCFGAPFMALHPTVYANMLKEKIAKHNVTCWLVNTGWSGGPYGVGQRMKIAYTRAMVHAALDGSLEKVETRPDPTFKVFVPASCPNVPAEILNPRSKDQKAYDEKAKEVAGLFKKNFEQFVDAVDVKVKADGPGA
jgi:phosphoenolpyruvate carboxykinase (ATP)